jgi:hypothetical protein
MIKKLTRLIIPLIFVFLFASQAWSLFIRIDTTIPDPTNARSVVNFSAGDNSNSITKIDAILWYETESNIGYWTGSRWSMYPPDPAPSPSTTIPLPSPSGTAFTGTYSFPTSIMTSGTRYYFKLKVHNNNDGEFSESTTCDFLYLYDSADPTLSLTRPNSSSNNYCSFTIAGLTVTAKYYNGSTLDNTWDKKITGTVSDPTPGSGLDRVELTIRKSTGINCYFNGTATCWDTNSKVSPTITGSSFYYLLPKAFFDGVANNDIITITVAAYDRAGNDAVITGRTFKIDKQAPTSTIITPGNANPWYFLTFPSSICGTSIDNFSGTPSVKLKIMRVRDGAEEYWNHAGYPTFKYYWGTNDGYYFNTTVTGTGTTRDWTYDASSVFNGIRSGDVFTVYSIATDAAGNAQSSPGTSKVLSYQPDGTILEITSPLTDFNLENRFSEIRVTATGIPIRFVKASIRRLYNGISHFWNWSTRSWVRANEIPPADILNYLSPDLPFVSPGNYRYTIPSSHINPLFELPAGPADGSVFYLCAWASNEAGALAYSEPSVIVYDNTPPDNPTPLGIYALGEVKWQNDPNAQIVQVADFSAGSDPIPAPGVASGLQGYASYYINPGGTSIDIGVITPADPTTISWSLGSEGIYSLNVQSIDNAWNLAPTPVVFRVGYDITDPNDFPISFPANGSEIDTLTPKVQWTNTGDAGDHPSGIKEYSVTLDGTISLDTTTGTSLDILPGNLTNGPHHIDVVAIDQAGNPKAASTDFTVRTRVAPLIEITSPITGTATNAATVNVTGTAADDSRVVLVEISVNGGTYTNIPITSSHTVPFDTRVALTTNTTNIIKVRATDDTSMQSDEAIRSVICDTDPPSGFGLISPANDSWTSSRPSFKWEPSSDYLSGLAGYDLYIVDIGKVNTELITKCAYALTSALSDSDHSYYVVAWDNAGNSRTSDTFTFKVDSQGPGPFNLTSPAEGQYIETAFDVSWTPSSDDNSGLAAYDIYIGGEKKAEAGASATTLTITDVPSDGNYALYVEARDAAGNTTPSNAVNITTNPNAPTITLLVNDKAITSGSKLNSLPNLKAQIADNSGIDPTSIKIKIDGQVQGAAADLQAAQVQAAAVTAYDARKNDVRLKSGKHSIRVEAKDVFGKEAVLEVTDLDVLGKAVIDGKPLNFPNPFKPSFSQNTSINYTLLDDADIKINIYDLSGRLVIVKICNAGTEGGRFGENNVIWDGKSLYGDIQANGVYVYLIATTKGEVIGTGEISIYE